MVSPFINNIKQKPGNHQVYPAYYSVALQLGSLSTRNRNFTYPIIEARQNLKRIGWSSQDGQAGSVEMLLLDYQEPWQPCPGLDFLPMAVHPADVPWPAGSAP